MTLDMLLIAVGWALVTTSSAVYMRRFRQTKIGPFVPREHRRAAPRMNWQVKTLFIAGVVVAVWGGAGAQRHHIGYWAPALVFLPMLVATAVVTVVHNRRIKPDATDRPPGMPDPWVPHAAE